MTVHIPSHEHMTMPGGGGRPGMPLRTAREVPSISGREVSLRAVRARRMSSPALRRAVHAVPGSGVGPAEQRGQHELGRPFGDPADRGPDGHRRLSGAPGAFVEDG